MKTDEIKWHFAALDYLDEAHAQALIAKGRVFATRARLTLAEARRHRGPKRSAPTDELAEYAGYIITTRPKDWNEAERLAAQRGFGEVVEGLITCEIPFIKPCLN